MTEVKDRSIEETQADIDTMLRTDALLNFSDAVGMGRNAKTALALRLLARMIEETDYLGDDQAAVNRHASEGNLQKWLQNEREQQVTRLALFESLHKSKAVTK